MRRVQVVVAAAVTLLASFLLLGGTIGAASARPTAGADTGFSFSTMPGLDPSFSSTLLDYAVRCTGSPTTQVTTGGSGTVTIGGRTFAGPASVNVPLVAGQDLVVRGAGSTYHLRCLPADFPTYSASCRSLARASA